MTTDQLFVEHWQRRVLTADLLTGHSREASWDGTGAAVRSPGRNRSWSPASDLGRASEHVDALDWLWDSSRGGPALSLDPRTIDAGTLGVSSDIRLLEVRVGVQTTMRAFVDGDQTVHDEHTDHWIGAEAVLHGATGMGSATSFLLQRNPVDGADDAVLSVLANGRAAALAEDWRDPSRTMPVLFTPYAVVELLEVLGETMTEAAVTEGNLWSALANRRGSRVASPALSLHDDPVGGPYPTALDDVGAPARTTDLIVGGVLTDVLREQPGCMRCRPLSTPAGTWKPSYVEPPTGGASSLAMSPGSETEATLVEAVRGGVVIGEIAGGHSGIDTTSGTLDVAVRGTRVSGEGGLYPFKNARLRANLRDLLHQVAAVGNEVQTPRSFPIRAPHMLVEGLSVGV